MPTKPIPLADRFWPKVNKNGRVVRPALGPCWEWTASTSSGYGKISIPGQSPARAHRVSLLLLNGEWPPDCVLHLCDNRRCVRPEHLAHGSRGDNNRDTSTKGRMLKKLTVAQVEDAVRRAADGEGPTSIARSMGVRKFTIQCHLKRRRSA